MSTRMLAWAAIALAGILLLTSRTISTPLYAAQMSAGANSPQHNGWKTYRSERAGYTVKYPASWVVSERTGPNGSLITTFRRPDGRAAIEVTVYPGTADATVDTDLENMRCHPVKVRSLSGTQCLDTISFSLITTFVGRDKTYLITASAKRLSMRTYRQFVRSFRLLP